MAAPTKPLYGQPCNGCGLCCVMQQCPVSAQLFGPKELCPALEAVGEAYTCGLIASPSRYFDAPEWGAALVGEAIGMILGAGTGCDAVANDADQALWDKDGHLMRGRARAAYDAARPEVQAMMRAIGAKRP